MNETYPRDMVGYGRTPPFADWPGGARVALQFVINYEEGGENNILHGDAASEAFLSEIIGAVPWPGQRHMNMESIYEYGPRAGFWRLHRMFTERDMPVTVFAVATAMARNPAAVAAMNEAGWEIATHGYKWIDYRDTPEDVERRHIADAVAIHTEVAGARPLGFYQGRSSVNTIRLGCEEGGFLYCADTYADDLPYWIEGPRGPQLIVPYTLDANDMRFAAAQGFNSGDQFYCYLKDSFDTLYAEGATAPKMLSIGLHNRLVGRPGRAASLARFLDYVAEPRKGVGRDPARHRAPLDRQTCAAGRLEAVEADAHAVRRALRRRLRAFALGRRGGLGRKLGAAEDGAEGLARAMARAMKGGSEAAKRALVAAHPDLAGKLALAKSLTADSTREQRGAGLDRLSAEELQRFAALNAAYRARFGFPFIMAVKGRSKMEILAAFERRLEAQGRGGIRRRAGRDRRDRRDATEGHPAVTPSASSAAES